MIILQKNDSSSSGTTLMAEFIAEFFEGKSIEQVFKIGGKSAPKALKLLAELNLIRIEGDKIVLTEEGREFVSLPYIEGSEKERNTFEPFK